MWAILLPLLLLVAFWIQNEAYYSRFLGWNRIDRLRSYPRRISHQIEAKRKIIEESESKRKIVSSLINDIDDYVDDYDVGEVHSKDEKNQREIRSEATEVGDDETLTKKKKVSEREKKESASLTYLSLRTNRLNRIQNKYDQAGRDSMMGMLNFKPYGFSGEDSYDDEEEVESENSEVEEQDIGIENNSTESLLSKRSRMRPVERLKAVQAIHNTSTTNFFQW